MKEKEKYFNYTMEPGKTRQREEFYFEQEPIISIITPYYNSKEYITQTANSIFNQTFPYWEWVIVNDGSTQPGTKEILDELAKKDSRIKIYHESNSGRIEARDKAVSKAKADLLFILDSDDVIDKTMLECAYWTLQTNPKASWVYSNLANFDGKQFLWNPIFDCEREKKENLISVCALIKKEALLSVGGYGVVDKDVHEDWHLWLRMLEKQYIPVRMNFYGFWYRNKKEGGVLASFNKDKQKDKHAKEEIKKQAQKIRQPVPAIQFPATVNPNYDTYPYTFRWNKPILDENKKIKLLFIFPWFQVGGADKFNYDLISNLDQEKYQITILTTEVCDYIWRQKFEKYAEVFDLTSFLHRKDWSAFMHYIIKTRHINIVMNSNSYYAFYIIPWLKSEFPEVVFTDYLHSENFSWRNGEYPRDSTAICGFLDKSYTCTQKLKNSMKINMNRSMDNVKTVYIGVDENEFDEEKVHIEDYPEINENKEKYTNKKIILFVCRISEEKRPMLMLKIMEKIWKDRDDVVLFVVGDGPELEEMKKLTIHFKLQDAIVFWGMQNDVKPFYKLADVSVICSLVEGLTITTYESLSMKTPVVTARVGGQAELVDDTCGRIVDNIQTDKDGYYNWNYSEEEINRYVKAILEVLNSPDYEKMRQTGRKKILGGFTIQNMVNTFDKEFTDFYEKGTCIDKKSVINKDLYKQYLVLHNQLNIRKYFDCNEEEDDIKYRKAQLKDKLWSNPIWRTLVTFLQKTGIMKGIKKVGIDKKVKKVVEQTIIR